MDGVLLARAHNVEAVLSLLPLGVVVLVSESLRLESANRMAHGLLGQHKGLMLDAGQHLVATSIEANRALQQHLGWAAGRAAHREAQPFRSLRVQGLHGALHLGVAPLPAKAPEVSLPAVAEVVAVAVFVSDPDAMLPTLPEVLCQTYRLTRAEAQLTAALAQGLTLVEVAQQRGLSMNTVRTQLKSASAKVGVRRQADLVRVALSGAMAWG
ncbi:MAG: helix-turn-helix transcriptional regulator [Sphaerotilus sp.]|nr:helix-turn-helix transcriptional regulator [Sphaerotilus sp.]